MTTTQWIQLNRQKLIDISRYIWENPELALDEKKASQLMMKVLREEGFEIRENLGGMETAFSATWGSGKPVIGYLGEYDALSDLSQAICGEKKAIVQGAPGHGCGHNQLGTATLASALALKHYMQEHGTAGTVVFYGCPAEETMTGKILMAGAGEFRDLDVALTWHPGSDNRVLAQNFLAMNTAKFNFYGVSSHAAAALIGSWIGGSDNMVAVQAVLNVPEGDMGACIIIDNLYYSVWIAFLLWAPAVAGWFNKFTKADTSYLDNINIDADDLLTKAGPVDFASLIFLFGLALGSSALTQYLGGVMGAGPLGFFDGGTWTVILGTFIGVFAGMSPLAKLGGKDELSNMLCYIVVSLIASRAGFNELFDAPIWLVFGAVGLAIHVVLFTLIAKVFKLDMYACGVASMACVGGTGSAPVIAAAYHSMLIPVGILMGIFGGLLGNFLALMCDKVMVLF
jgi:uncharacterized membrane protein